MEGNKIVNIDFYKKKNENNGYTDVSKQYIET